MLNKSLAALFILYLSLASAQTPKYRVLNVPVERDGIWLREPWAGGLNAPQFSSFDLNHDGIKDLFVFDRDGFQVLTYLSNGDGTDSMFSYAPQYESVFPGDLSQYALIRDYNNDGIPDIFTFSPSNAGISVYKGSIENNRLKFDLVNACLVTDSPFSQTIFSNYLDVPVFTDVNRDGDIDILTYDVFGSNVGYYENQTMEHPGNPAYVADSLKYRLVTSCWGYFSQAAGSNAISLNVSCKGGDAGQPSGGNTRHAGNSLYNFEDPTYHTVDLLNGNIGFENLSLLQNCGDSINATVCVSDSIYPQCNTPMLMSSYPAAYGVDVNSDGMEDLLVAPNQTTEARDVHNVMYYKNTGNASCLWDYQDDSFLVHNMLDFGTASKGLFYDFDGDGLTDIIVGNYGYFQPDNPYKSGIAFYKNTGTATKPVFVQQSLDYDSLSAYQLQGVNPAFGDMDGDGHADMIIGEIGGNLYYFKNTATTGSSFPVLTAANFDNLKVSGYAAPFIYDVNGDSLPDLVVGRDDGGISYFWNFGTKTAPMFSPDSVNLYFGNVSVAVSPDVIGYSQPYIRRDTGGLKLFVGSKLGYIYEYIIDSTKLRSGSFTLVTSNYLNQRIGNQATISIADINNDGQLEYLVGNSRGGLLLFSDSLWDSSTLPLSVAQVPGNNLHLNIYPNPAKQTFTCQLPGGVFKNPKVEFYDITGRRINIETTLFNNKISVSPMAASSGVYFIRIYDQGAVYYGKVLVERP